MKVVCKGLKKAKADLNVFEKKVDKYMQLLGEALAREGCRIASAYYSNAPYAGENDVVVEAISTDKYRAEVRATGHAVMFIEFGTGITMSGAPEAETKLMSGFPLPHGQYGQGRGASEKGWFYKGEIGNNPPAKTEPSYKKEGLIHTYGNPATPAMYWSRKEVCEHFEEILNEVINSD